MKLLNVLSLNLLIDFFVASFLKFLFGELLLLILILLLFLSIKSILLGIKIELNRLLFFFMTITIINKIIIF